ncbi:ribose ABC transporter permease [Christensenellaceae bacterium]|nr:ribose ABC transporter permease [Christensenellaceae bacterium]BDF62282.1 ribose ABC transporter permease [Christensenellaceae bacterium]
METTRYTIKESGWKKFARQGGVLLCLLAICVFFTIISPHFFNERNLISVVLQASINIIVALGMTVVIITGGIDLSVGPILAVCGVVLAQMLVNGTNAFLAVLAALALGVLMGLINGSLISVFNLQPFLVTLGTMSIYRGLALVYTTGKPVPGVPDSYTSVIGGKIGIIPVPVIIMIAIVLLVYCLLKFTKIGVYIFAIGGNVEAAKLSGINVTKYKMTAYVISGLACALGAVVMVGRLGAAEPTAATGYELDAIAASAIGGASLAGGKGSVIGTVLGALILAVLKNGMTLLNVQSYYQQIATGIVIILAVMLDHFTNSTKK